MTDQWLPVPWHLRDAKAEPFDGKEYLWGRFHFDGQWGSWVFDSAVDANWLNGSWGQNGDIERDLWRYPPTHYRPVGEPAKPPWRETNDEEEPTA